MVNVQQMVRATCLEVMNAPPSQVAEYRREVLELQSLIRGFRQEVEALKALQEGLPPGSPAIDSDAAISVLSEETAHTEDGALVLVDGVRSLSGEASITTSAAPRRRRAHAFDLKLELAWRARACDVPFSGVLVFSEVASHNGPDEYELSLQFDERPEPGSEAEATLVNLFGPLRRESALATSDKLTSKLWEAIDGFRHEFMQL